MLALICSMLWCSMVYSYQEITHISDIMHHIDHTLETLIIFDIDNTLIEPDNQDGYGSDQWVSALMHYCQAHGVAPHEAWGKVAPHYYQAVRDITVKPVETHTSALVATLQQRYHTICITARSAHLSDITHEQLKQHGMHFDRTHTVDNHDVAGLPHPCRYDGGILFVSDNDKGQVLQKYCAMRGLLPRQIVFVDDKLKHVLAVERAAHAMGISSHACKCFHYVHLQPKVQTYVLQDHHVPAAWRHL